jgi:hypothetical protein
MQVPRTARLVRAIANSKDVGWLRRENSSRQPLLERLRSIASAHEPVVYAISLTDEILRGVRYGHGLEVVHPIGPERLIAKTWPALRREWPRSS